jgi:serine phosphatase RsbU (regulator of sigma subunit)
LEYLPTKRSIGSFGEPGGTFKTQKIQLQEGDVIFACSDGYADQFGGPNNKKFMRKTFKDLLRRVAPLEMEAQKEALQHEFDSWKGSNEQTDDILVIGIRI